ncbi:MAG: hypothetical protein ABJC10_04430 [Acidobacteriota bacterium]
MSLLLILLAFFCVTAQVSDQEKQENEAARKQQVERKTYALVEEIAGGALSLKLPENRSYILAAAADLLWEHDEPRARNLFWDALNTLNLINSATAGDSSLPVTKNAKPSAKEQEQALSEYIALFSLRQELLQRVAGRDPQLALDMLRSSRQAPVEPPAEWIRGGFSLPDDRQLEQQIAAVAASRNPEKALQLARESLGKGFSYQLFDLLFKLNQKDAQLATKFAGDIVDKLRSSSISTNLQASQIAVSLLTFSRAPAEAQAARESTPALRQLKLAEEQRRELVEIITNAALTESANGNLLFDLNAIMPEIKEFAPERITLLQKKLAAFNQTLNKEQKASQEYNTLQGNGTPEEMLKSASTAPDNDREWLRQQAISKAVMDRRADSLREFVNTEIDESQRKSLIDAIDAEEISLAAYKGDAEALQKVLPKIRRREERARAMAAIAVSLEKKGHHDDALSLLDEAQTLVKLDLNSETQTNALLALAGAYALVEPAKAFGIIERVVDRANEELMKALLLDKIVRSGMVKKGEIRMAHAGPIDFAIFKYGKSVAALANADFDRTRAAADRFERNELRLMARLLLAQTVLRHEDTGPKDTN